MKLIAVIIAMAFLLTAFSGFVCLVLITTELEICVDESNANDIVNAQVEDLPKDSDEINQDSFGTDEQDSFGTDEVEEVTQKLEKQPGSMMQLMIWLAVLILAYAIAQLCTHILNQLAKRRKKPEFIFRWLLPIFRAIIYVCAFYIVFSGIIRRIEYSGYIIIGALAIAFGLASRDLLNSLLGGFVILFDRPFRIGDRIKINGYEGEVISMGLWSVKVMTSDGKLVVVPNSRFLRQIITSAAAGSMNSPVEFEFILPNSVPLEQMEKIAKEAVLTSKYVYLAEPVLVTSTDDFRGIFLTKLKIKASVFDYRYATQFAEDVKTRVKAELGLDGRVPLEARQPSIRRGDLNEDYNTDSQN